jgi:hypothetical protein
MPLNYDLTKINNYEELLNDSNQLKEPYKTLILSTMIVGLGEITEKNYVQFYNRINIIERISGAYLWDSETKNPSYVEQDDIKRMIGLKVNVANQTKAKFISTIKRMLPQEL